MAPSKTSNNDDIYSDYVPTDNETLVYYDSGNLIPRMWFMGLFPIAIALYLVIKKNDSLWYSSLLILLGGYLFYDQYTKVRNKDAQIIVNDLGMQTSSVKFYSWDDIKNEMVETRYEGKSTVYYLTYDYPTGSTEIKLNDLTIDKDTLETMMAIHRDQYNKNHQK